MDREDPIAAFFPGEEDVDLYGVLKLTNGATLDAIKKAYRRLALVYHPDKHVNSSDAVREEASLKFQQVGFSYGVLGDEKRRLRYDKTGRTDEGFELQAGEGGWDAYFADLFEGVTKGRLDELKKEYQGSEEEKADIRAAYLATDSTIEEIISHIPHSTFDDEPRIIELITVMIKDGQLKKCKAWEKSVKDEKAKLVRRKQADSEAAEAESLAKELGVWDEFYGNGKAGPRKGKGKSKASEADEEGDTSALQALILKRRKNTEDIFDNIAAKYADGGGKTKGKAGKKRRRDEQANESALPDINDDEFAKLQQKLFGDKAKTEAEPVEKKASKRSRSGKA